MAAREGRLEVSTENGVLKLSGFLDAENSKDVWKKAFGKGGVKKVDASQVTRCDGAGLALLFVLSKRDQAEIEGLKPEFQRLFEQFKDAQLPKISIHERQKDSLVEYVGKVAVLMAEDMRQLVVFTGQLTITLVVALAHPRKIRWNDLWVTAEKVGVNALVIIGMIGFLMGLIMAFQSTVPLQQFGVDIFVVNLVALAMLRELGVIMTSILLAGRSGSAFAAEIGTMKVNEEIDALTTMGLDPVRFLVVPKVLAAVIMTPVLTVYANAFGIAGGLLVVAGFGHPWAAVINQLQSAVEISDIASGMIKSVVFGLLVGGIGCLRGLQTRSGATAVGDSTTRAVVSGIFLIVLVDALFAFIFYALKF